MSPMEACNIWNIAPRTLRRKAANGEFIKRRKGKSVEYKKASTYQVDPAITPINPSDTYKAKKEYNQEVIQFLSSLENVSKKYKTRDDDSQYNIMSNSSESLGLLISDTHIGKVTKYFDTKIVSDRILSITDLLEPVLAYRNIQEIVLILAGDLVDGEDIYAHQSHSLAIPVIDQAKVATELLWTLINDIHSTYNINVRVETCPGNHGRMSKTANPKTNWDNVTYQMLGLVAGMYKNTDIVVNAKFDTFNTFMIQDKLIMACHEGPKHLGTAAMQMRAAGWLQKEAWDLLAFGHWHNWSVENLFGKPCICNGSLLGMDDLAERCGWIQPPRQGWFHVVNNVPLNEFGFLQWTGGY